MHPLALPFLHGLRGAAPLVLRVLTGGVMFAHGIEKVLLGPDATAGAFFRTIGFPAPTASAYLVTALELGGGVLLIVGLLSRLTAVVLTVEMLVAGAVVAGLGVGLIAPATQPGVGYERNLLLVAGSLAIALLGPGRRSLDHLIGIDGSAGRVGDDRGAGDTAGARR